MLNSVKNKTKENNTLLNNQVSGGGANKIFMQFWQECAFCCCCCFVLLLNVFLLLGLKMCPDYAHVPPPKNDPLGPNCWIPKPMGFGDSYGFGGGSIQTPPAVKQAGCVDSPNRSQSICQTLDRSHKMRFKKIIRVQRMGLVEQPLKFHVASHTGTGGKWVSARAKGS